MWSKRWHINSLQMSLSDVIQRVQVGLQSSGVSHLLMAVNHRGGAVIRYAEPAVRTVIGQQLSTIIPQ